MVSSSPILMDLMSFSINYSSDLSMRDLVLTSVSLYVNFNIKLSRRAHWQVLSLILSSRIFDFKSSTLAFKSRWFSCLLFSLKFSTFLGLILSFMQIWELNFDIKKEPCLGDLKDCFIYL
jgi:hypothetical protein